MYKNLEEWLFKELIECEELRFAEKIMEEQIELLIDKAFKDGKEMEDFIIEIYSLCYNHFKKYKLNYDDIMKICEMYAITFHYKLLKFKADWREQQINKILE